MSTTSRNSDDLEPKADPRGLPMYPAVLGDKEIDCVRLDREQQLVVDPVMGAVGWGAKGVDKVRSAGAHRCEGAVLAEQDRASLSASFIAVVRVVDSLRKMTDNRMTALVRQGKEFGGDFGRWLQLRCHRLEADEYVRVDQELQPLPTPGGRVCG